MVHLDKTTEPTDAAQPGRPDSDTARPSAGSEGEVGEMLAVMAVPSGEPGATPSDDGQAPVAPGEAGLDGPVQVAAGGEGVDGVASDATSPGEPETQGAPAAPSWVGHGYSFAVHNCAKFHRSIYLKAWCSHASGAKPGILDVRSRCADMAGSSWVRLPDVSADSPVSGFELQMLLGQDRFPQDIEIELDMDGWGEPVRLDWAGLQAAIPREGQDLRSMFSELLAAQGAKQLLDIGGRARSGVLYAEMFPGVHTEVLDILPGEGVTIVCDAHRMSQVLEPQRFDAVISISVFEHLVMPWKVAVEMNRVMKTGGVALIHSHQTIGMHDMPWDFFRYSDSAWKAIFNAYTGFEIITSTMRDLNFIIPFYWSDRYQDAEKAAGFECSTVLIRKVREPQVDWPLSADQITADLYPGGELPREPVPFLVAEASAAEPEAGTLSAPDESEHPASEKAPG